MKCLDCGMNYVGMKRVSKYNCPHCSVKDENGELWMTYEHYREHIQKVSSYEITFYDMDDNVMLIPDKPLKRAYSEIDQAIYEWENNDA